MYREKTNEVVNKRQKQIRHCTCFKETEMNIYIHTHKIETNKTKHTLLHV